MADFTQRIKGKKVEKTRPAVAPTVWLYEADSVGAMNNGLAVAEALNPNYRTVAFLGLSKQKDGTLKVDFKKGDSRVTEIITPDKFPDVFIDSAGGYAMGQWNARPIVAPFDRILPVHMTSPNFVFDAKDHGPIGYIGRHTNGLQVTYKHQVADGEQIPPHVRVMATVPTRVNAKALEAERREWEKRFFPEGIKHPVYCVMSSRGNDMNEMEELAGQVAESLRKTGGSLLLTTAPATHSPEKVIDIFKQATAELKVPTCFYNYDDTNGKNNPYLGMLAVADKIVLPHDSISMTSDALATGKPIYQFPVNTDELYDYDYKYNHSLQQSGAILPLSQLSRTAPNTAPVNSAEEIAQTIRDELKARGERRGSQELRQQGSFRS